MKSMLAMAGLWWALIALVPDADQRDLTFIDLQPQANHKLDENFHRGIEGNHLGALPRGEQVFGKVRFKVEEGLIQLGSTLVKNKPEKVEGIVVNRKLRRLHLLHGTGYGAYGDDDHPFHVKDDALIGEYLVHYEDKTTQTIPIVYGKDVRDWWNWDQGKAVTRGKVVWEGENEFSKQNEVKLRVYLTSWENPHPGKRLMRIDYRSTNETAAAPFCLAITAEK